MSQVYSANGSVKISNEAIAIIAGTAAQEVEGVLTPAGEDGERGKRNFAKGVKVGVTGDRAKVARVKVAINISVREGYGISEVSAAVQRKVKTAIETMTGMFVAAVDVYVQGLAGAKRNEP